MSTYAAGLRPAVSYASNLGRIAPRTAPLVPTCADADVTVSSESALRAAVASADDSVICVGANINLTGTDGPIVIDDTSTVTIVGAGSGVTITGHTDDTGIFRSYQGSDNADDTLTFANLTLEGGLAHQGGAIYVKRGAASDALVIDDVHFIDNEALSAAVADVRGGAIYASRPRSVLITNSTFSGNSASQFGGAVWVANFVDDIVIQGSTFTQNVVSGAGGSGGAVAIFGTGGGSVHFEGNVFEDNTALGEGAITAQGFQSLRSVGNVFEGNHIPVTGSVGAFLAYGNVVEIIDDSFVGNTSNGIAGALYLRAHTASVIGTYFSDNHSASMGGAVYAKVVDLLTISDSQFTVNSTGQYGGAVYVTNDVGGDDVVIEGSVFTGNSVTAASGVEGGGALAAYNRGDVSIRDTSFEANTSGGTGGALLLWTDLYVEGSTFSGNRASAGGAVHVSYTHPAPHSHLEITNSTLVDNTATDSRLIPAAGYEGGGAILGLGARLTLDFVTVTGNHADDSTGLSSGPGGGIHVGLFGAADDTLIITNSIVAGNTSDGSGRDLRVSDPDVPTIIDYSAVTDANSVSSVRPASILNLIYAADSPLLLGPLQDNGGPTRTMVPGVGSSAIDEGNPAWSPPPNTDQRGTGFPRLVGTRADLGAVEGTGAPDPTPTPTPVVPASAPRAVVASAGDASATVKWQAPTNSGSFPVSTYHVTSVPAAGSCLTTALSCTVTGLGNGTSYTFRVKALNGAGWGASSALSNAVTPRAEPKPAIMIAGTRSGRTIAIAGEATGLPSGSVVTPWMRLGLGRDFVPGRDVAVADDGTFTWSRRASTKNVVHVYATSDDVRSNTVRLQATAAP
jgi:hypothetical protein